VSAVQLVTEYKTNELQADQKYQGSWLEVEGGVNDVSKNTEGTPYLVLHGSEGAFSWITVRCFISKRHAEWAPRIVRGQRIKVRGRCSGKPSDVHILDCEFVQEPIDLSPWRPAPSPGTYIPVNLRELYSVYDNDKAKGDAKYLDRGVEITIQPLSIRKDEFGRYYADVNIYGAYWDVEDAQMRNSSINCYFRTGQAAALDAVRSGQNLTVHGICAGVSGWGRAYIRGNRGADGFIKSLPVIDFRDCVIGGGPAGRPVSEPPAQPIAVLPGEKKSPPQPADPGPLPRTKLPDKPSENPDTPQLIILNGHAAYESCLHKQVQFKCRPQGVHRDDAGIYSAWQFFGGVPHKFCFRADQGAVVAEIKAERLLTVSGVYAGKSGSFSAATFTDCELLGKPAGTPLEKPAEKAAEKPLALKELIDREIAQRKEMDAVRRSGNFNMRQQLEKEHEAERASWRGKPVKGKAQVVAVYLNTVRLSIQEDERHIHYIFAVSEDLDDPILRKLERGNVVEILGTIERQAGSRDGAIRVKDCVFTLKK
jgi:hypothetical protein